MLGPADGMDVSIVAAAAALRAEAATICRDAPDIDCVVSVRAMRCSEIARRLRGSVECAP